jgi:predicted nuclease with RNAse H fold
MGYLRPSGPRPEYPVLMLTTGVDLAARPERTALVSIEWTADQAVIRDVAFPADDTVILKAIDRADKTGIDCPLGWPAAFVEFVAAHHAGHVSIPEDGPDWRHSLTMRRTDIYVHERFRLVPLSVSADRIAHVALRCAVLLAKLDAAGRSVDRSGSGHVVEVYPAASLRRWGLYQPGYKQPAKPGAVDRVVDHLLAAAPWLDCASYEQAVRRSHDVLDAVIAAMTARAAVQGQTYQPGEADLAAARTEGWIAIPDSPISQLL